MSVESIQLPRGLTAAQKEARVGKLTASRVACLMTGEIEKIHLLWLEMTGKAEEEDLSHVWAVQLGAATEQLNLDWAERRIGEPIIDRGFFIQHPIFDWAGATIDGMSARTHRLVEAKHVGGRESLETIIDRYQPQLQWQMECDSHKTEEIVLSIIIGANEPIIEIIPRDEDYAAEMIRRGCQFMRHVANGTPPVALPPMRAPVIPTQSYDMYGNNQWAMYAAIWLNTKQEAERFKDADKEIRTLVPPDAKECKGYGLIAKRDRGGRIRLTEDMTL